VNDGTGKGLVVGGIALVAVVLIAAGLISTLYFRSRDGNLSSGENEKKSFQSGNSEVTQEAQREFEKSFTRCGDSYFAELWPMAGLGQFKEVAFTVTQKPLDEADRANAVEWIGICQINCKLIRIHDGKQWGEWRTPGDWMPFAYGMRKRRGQWEVKLINLLPSALAGAKKIQCDRIPGENPTKEQEQEAAAQRARREAESRTPTRTIGEYENMADYQKGTTGKVKLTDVDVSFSQSGEQLNVWFGLIRSMETRSDFDSIHGGTLYYVLINFKSFQQNRDGARVEMGGDAGARERFYSDLQTAVRAWREKFAYVR